MINVDVGARSGVSRVAWQVVLILHAPKRSPGPGSYTRGTPNPSPEDQLLIQNQGQ